MGRIIAFSRYIFLAAVFALLAMAVVLIVYGTVEVGLAVVELFTEPGFDSGGGKEATLEVVEVVDIFLLGIAVFILGTGMYTLFINAEGLPESMRVKSLGEMKAILASTIILVIGVGYLGVLLRPGMDAIDKAWIGLGSAAVIAALTFYVRNADRH